MKFPGGVGYGRNSFTMSDAFYLYMTFILVKQMFYLNKPYNVVIFISSFKNSWAKHLGVIKYEENSRCFVWYLDSMVRDY